MSIRCLCPFLLFLHACIAWAQVDSPFVPLLIALNLDGVDNKEVYRCYKDQQGRLWLNAADLKGMGFPAMKQPPLRYKERDYFPLDKYEGVEYELDENLWLLKIRTPVTWHPKQVISSTIPLDNSKLRPKTPGVFLNYDASGGYNGFLKDNYTAAFTEAGLFSAYGVGTSSFLINGYDYLQQRNDVLRLDTAWTFDQPERISSWRFGDSISSGLSWSGAVRFAGIQYATNFATQPSLITMPQPNIYGEANLPSSIDVLVNGMNTRHQSVNKGTYEVTQVPIVTGQGAIQVVTTDLLGRQQVNTFDYYASPLLLKPGLSNYSYELGSIRRAYANENFNYGRALGVVTYSLGITNKYTAGVHVELLQEQQTIGFLNNYLLGDFGVFSVGLAGSSTHGRMRCYNNEIKRGLGGLFSLGFSRQTNFLSYGVQSTLATHDYMQLGMLRETAHPNLMVQSYVALAMGKAGSLSLSYTQLNNNFFYPNQVYAYPFLQSNDQVLILNYNKNLWGRLFLNVGVVSGLNNNKQGFINLVMPLGADKSLSVNENIFNHQHQETVQLNKNLPLGNGYGYQLTAATNKSSPIQTQLNVQTNQGLFGASYLGFAGANSTSLNARGSIIGFGHRVFPARYVDQAFALVEVAGFDPVSVYSRNQLIGKTNRKGYLYIPELLPYQRNELYIDNKELPMNAQVAQYNKTVVPYYKSGVLVKFDVETIQNTLLTIRLPNGSVVPSGSSVFLEHSSAIFPVGYHGQVFISSAKTNRLAGRVVWNDRQCHFNVRLTPSTKIIKRETVVCS